MTTDDETVAEAEAQMEAAAEAIRGAVPRLLQHVVLAAAGVTGELGADIARLGDADLGTVLGDLADLGGRPAGRTPRRRRWRGAPDRASGLIKGRLHA